MPTEPATADVTTEAIAQPQAIHSHSLNPAKWLICLLLAGFNAWIGFTNPPVFFVIPVELQSVDPNSSKQLQEKRAEADSIAYRNNVMFQFTWAGFFLGSVGIIASLLTGLKRFGLGIISSVFGLPMGLLAGLTGAAMRPLLDKGKLLASLGEDLRPLVADMLVLSVVSMILVVPIGLYVFFSGQNDARQKSVSTILAGFLAGMMTPVLISMFTVFSLLAPDYNTEIFPLVGLPVISLWLGLMLVMVFVASTMIRTRAAKSSKI